MLLIQEFVLINLIGVGYGTRVDFPPDNYLERSWLNVGETIVAMALRRIARQH